LKLSHAGTSAAGLGQLPRWLSPAERLPSVSLERLSYGWCDQETSAYAMSRRITP
jgi:hypothetical protein